MKRTQPWNAARAASRRPLRKPIKMLGPVGNDANNVVTFTLPPGPGPTTYRGERGDSCRGCGTHVCSCTERQRIELRRIHSELARIEFDHEQCPTCPMMALDPRRAKPEGWKLCLSRAGYYKPCFPTTRRAWIADVPFDKFERFAVEWDRFDRAGLDRLKEYLPHDHAEHACSMTCPNREGDPT